MYHVCLCQRWYHHNAFLMSFKYSESCVQNSKKDMLRVVWQVRGKGDRCLYLLPYRRWRVICTSNLAQGQAAARVPDKHWQAPMYVANRGRRGAPNVHL